MMIRVLGTGAGDVLTASPSEASRLEGLAGDDVLSGSAATDTLYGADGRDVLSDAAGGDDHLYGGAGDDSLILQRGPGEFGSILLDGGADDDRLMVSYAAVSLDPHPPVTLSGGSGNDVVFVSNVDSLIFGGSGDDFVSSTDGHATVEGGAGADFVETYVYSGEYRPVVVDGGTGNDTVNAYNYRGDVSLEGGAGNDNLFGWARDAAGGAATLDGGSGDDTLSVNAQVIHLYGGAGNDQILGFGGEATLLGGSGNDLIMVESATAVVDAGSGLDHVVIREFVDSAVVTLGDGPDTLSLFGALLRDEPASVVVTDFRAGNSGDVLDLAFALSGGTTWTPADGSPFADGHLRIVQQGADTLLQVFDDRNGAGHWSTLADLLDVTASTLNAHNLDGFMP